MKSVPPRGRGCVKKFRCSCRVENSENPTHGSGWIVQIQPTCERAERVLKSHQLKLVDSSDPASETKQSRLFQSDLWLIMKSSNVDQQVGSEQSTNFRWWDFGVFTQPQPSTLGWTLGGRLVQRGDGKGVKASSDTVDVCKRQRSKVSAVCKQDKDTLIIRIYPTTRAGKPRVSKAIRRQVGSCR
jgi:hypothetical protein